jgi:deoxyadenosine/deoxycytidine kinase
MDERDYRSYRELYEVLTSFLPPPDLVVYLRASVPTFLKRIAMRGREYEKRIAPAYLEGLNRLYERWIEGFALCPVLTIPADELDFVANDDHLEQIAERVLERLQGREEVVLTSPTRAE